MSRFSETVMEHLQDPRNRGVLPDPDGLGVVGKPGGGPFFVLYLKLEGEIVREARFQCHGCGPTIASGSMLTDLITGSTLEQCRCLSLEDLLCELGGLPPDKRHCAASAVAALHLALEKRNSGK